MALNIGGNIKKLRAEKGITQEQLAERLSITYQSVSKWENNITSPDLYLIPAIADYFEISIDELFQPNMQGYKNKAARLFALYEHRGAKQYFDKADTEYEILITGNKADADDYRFYGMLNQFHAKKLNQKAEDCLRKSIEMGNEYSEGQLIGLLTSMGRNQENIDKYEEATKNSPELLQNWCNLIYSYAAAYFGTSDANLEKALALAKKCLLQFPENADLLFSCGNILRLLKKYEEAEAYFLEAIEKNPDRGAGGASYYNMAFMYTEAKNYKKAIWAWEQAIALQDRLGLPNEEAELGKEWPKKEIAKLQAIINEA
jgi:transcriptional regulator with XRE-family HTH domain